jgi:hypothetical protein
VFLPSGSQPYTGSGLVRVYRSELVRRSSRLSSDAAPSHFRPSASPIDGARSPNHPSNTTTSKRKTALINTLPFTAPATLEYAGLCIQARHVGGDYYDFLTLGRDRLGLVIGDIAGKGMPAALLMANLQANVRSQCAMALEEPERFLCSVNQLFRENTTESAS